MGYEFYILLVIAVILAAILIAVSIRAYNLNKEKLRYIEDNRKLFSKVKKLDSAIKDMTKSRDNLAAIHDDLKDQYETVNRIAYTDSLTELPNKQQFNLIFDGIMQGITDSDKVAFVLIRLLNLDRISNTAGSLDGNEFILDFTQRLKANLDDEDFLARTGLDEYAIITRGYETIADYEDRVQRLYNILKMPVAYNGREIIPEIALASSKAPADGRTVQLISMNTRLALSKAINDPEHPVYFYNNSMAEDTMKKMELTAALNQAVENSSFNYVYSVVNDLKTGKPDSLEVIPLLSTDAYGELYPKDYLEYAADTPVPKKLFALMFNEICDIQHSFEKAGFDNINFIISCFADHFTDDDFVNVVYSVLQKTEASPDRLILSISEAALTKDPTNVIAVMKKISKTGIKFRLDGFGSGNSSIKAIVNSPASIICLSENFLDGSFTISGDALLRSIVEMMHSWKMKITVPAVDYKEQEDLLRKLHADFAQGNLYGGCLSKELVSQYIRMSQK